MYPPVFHRRAPFHSRLAWNPPAISGCSVRSHCEAGSLPVDSSAFSGFVENCSTAQLRNRCSAATFHAWAAPTSGLRIFAGSTGNRLDPSSTNFSCARIAATCS